MKNEEVHGIDFLLQSIDKVNLTVGEILGYMIYPITFIVLYEVISRYVFNAPTVWALEMAQMIFGGYFMLAGGYCLFHHSHVTTDIFYSRMSPRGKAFINVLTSPLLLIFCIALLYGGTVQAWNSLINWQRSETAWAPLIAPLLFTVPFGALLLLFEAIVEFIRNIRILLTEAPCPQSGELEKR